MDIHTFDSNGHTLLYEVFSNIGINVLVTGNKLCTPVVGHYEGPNNISIFDMFEKLPCGLKQLIQNYKNQVEFSFQNSQIEATHNAEWNGMINGDDVYANRDIGCVDPLISTHWGQRGTHRDTIHPGYNYYTPSGNNCEHCYAGCVAVAMGQVKK